MTSWTEPAAIREWVRAQGFEISNSGRIPARLRDMWMRAGSPYPAYAPLTYAERRRSYQPASTEPVAPPDETRQFVATSKPTRGGGRGSDRRAVTAEREGRAREVLAAADAVAEAVVAEVSDDPESDLPQSVYTVTLVSGQVAVVLTQDEVDWFNRSRDAYLQQHRFTENTDLQDLDRLLQMELLQHRWNQWVLRGSDYDGVGVDDMELAKKIREQSTALNALKEQMGLSKKARDATAAGVAERWADLLQRAKEFGYHREEQLRTALLLMNRLSAIVGQFDRSDEEERQKAGFTSEGQILDWVRTEMLPAFHEVDAHFTANTQRFWRRA